VQHEVSKLVRRVKAAAVVSSLVGAEHDDWVVDVSHVDLDMQAIAAARVAALVTGDPE